MKRIGFLMLIGACGGGSPAKTPEPPQESEPQVKAFDLLVKGPAHVAAWRARPARRSRAWMTPKQPSQESFAPEWNGGYLSIQEVRDNRVRIFDEYDSARMLLWIPREDLAPSIVRETAVAMPGASGDLGVVARAGVPVIEQRAAGGDTHVVVAANDVRAEGVVPTNAVGDVWFSEQAPVEENGTDEQFLEEDTVIRAAAGADAPALATVTNIVYVRVHAAHDDWTEVQTLGSLLIARGMVKTSEVKQDEVDAYGSMMGDMLGYGAGSPSLTVPAGTCLYDGADGELVGVTTADQERTLVDDQGAWKSVEVHTWWGEMHPWVHLEAGQLERCSGPLGVEPPTDP